MSSAFIALTGFKGAVPILLAALVVLEKVPDAALVYRLVFVVVAVSVVAQGLALEPIARVLGVPMTIRRQRGWALRIPLRHEPEGVVRLAVVRGAIADGRRIRDLPIGEAAWVALVVRSGRTEQPRGSLRARTRRRGGAARRPGRPDGPPARLHAGARRADCLGRAGDLADGVHLEDVALLDVVVPVE